MVLPWRLPRLRSMQLVSRERRGRRPYLEFLESRNLLTAYSVTNSNDAGPGSFRQAILDANSNQGLDTITFAIPNGGVHTIAPLSELPTATDPVVIDAGQTLTPSIQLDGSHAGVGAVGLRIGGGDSTVRGLQIINFRASNLGNFETFDDGGFAIELSGPGGDSVTNNIIGCDPTGHTSYGNSAGIHVLNSANNSIVGNIISGNYVDGDNVPASFGAGIVIDGSGSTGNTLQQNYLGVNYTATGPLPNGSGVIISGASGNVIGGVGQGTANVISGNRSFGIWLKHNANNNVVEGNCLGTDSGGNFVVGRFNETTVERPLVNQVDVSISEGSSNNTIGGTASGAGNVISGLNVGVALTGTSVTRNVVEGNLIGLTAFGNQVLDLLGESKYGIVLSSPDNVIGGQVGNSIGGMAIGIDVGLTVSGDGLVVPPVFPPDLMGSVIQGNQLAVAGNATVPIFQYGILVERGAFNLVIGGNDPSQGNVITTSAANGIFIDDGQSITIQSNSIFGNGAKGIALNPATFPNRGSEAPQLLSITPNPDGTVRVTGTQAIRSGGSALVQIFANSTFEPPSLEQGQTPVGFASVQGIPDQISAFMVTLTLPPGQPFLTATSTDPFGDTSEFSQSIPQPAPQSDLIVTGPPTPIIQTVGQNLVYSFSVANKGPNAATNVVLTQSLPPGSTFVSASPSAGTFSNVAGVITANFGTIEIGATATLTITITPNQVGTFSLSGTVVADDSDPSNANNTASQTLTIVAVPVDLLTISQIASPSPIYLGGSITLVVSVANVGAITATGVKISDTLPSGVILVSAISSQGAVTVDTTGVAAAIGTLKAGTSATLTIVVRPTTSGPLTNVAVASSNESDGKLENNTSNLIVNVLPDGPRIATFLRLGYHRLPTRLILTFNQSLNATLAQNPLNYRLREVSRRSRGARSTMRKIAIKTAYYDPVSLTVTLRPSIRLNRNQIYQLTVIGTLANTTGTLLDGQDDGTPGTSFVGRFLGSNLIETSSRKVPQSSPR